MKWIEGPRGGSTESGVFSGVYQHTIDAKGRTSLPSSFRDVLAGQGADKIFVTTDLFEGCLQAYAPEEWSAFVAKVTALPQFDEGTRHIVRAMISPAHECPFDKLGRILLPPQLREHAGFSEQVVWAGAGKRIELWTPAGWKECQAQVRSAEVQKTLRSQLAKML